ncbi:hypothetical protein G6011_02702 [Alternaria panax]|uniref:Uncharacterized protein n=1 Tax=Alternaria panax TaxID=48097 RepID=A0AAD4I739_9PLEO|nr:hypothetical protein G6011_02702 [Alternaria panax]
MLSLDTYNNMELEFLGQIAPITTLTAFDELEYLTVLQELLLGGKSPDPVSLLPASIRGLELLHPIADVLDWLVTLNGSIDDFPNLKAVHLFCGNGRGDSYLAMHAKYEAWAEHCELHYDLIIYPADQRVRLRREQIPREIYRETPEILQSAPPATVPTAVPSLDDNEAFPPLASLSLRHRRQP